MAIQYGGRGKSASAITASFEQAIRDGRLAPGEKVPAVRALAGSLGVSPATVAAAYRTLRTRGVVSTAGRRGTRVTGRPPIVARAAPPVPTRARNLAAGSPDPALLPPLAPVLARLGLRHRLYGEPTNRSDLLALAARQFTADGIPADAVAVVGGALDGIERALQAHLRPGDRVAVEDPGYPAVIDLVTALGLVIEPVRVDDYGPLPDDLARALAQRALACIVTPRAQNPTGAALDERRARTLCRLLHAHPDVLILEDDHAGPVAGARALTLCGRKPARWAVVRSVSKSLGPDLRLALMTGDPVTVSRVEGRQVLGSGWVSHILQEAVVRLWSEPQTRGRLRAAEGAYTARRRALVAALARHGIEAHARSGLNVWIPVREELPTVRALLDAGWAVSGGERYRLRSPPAVRVTIARLREDEIEPLADAIAQSLAPSGHGYSA